ncbi:hypothetical protein AZI86_13120 [Bdellovibrio bacteriovorus]|uniref:Secreted protein n=1 Tax=Bdellovibrio bacteriovorus TaxID=959 RepID=A0A150WJ87_BDEBC|nr:hypothetical protein [Bdellovibrio bacteriovorus]KYG63760.1 hypothetical protein AZI86_13120 [Bdellovibrio bacteriovorus]
MRFLALLLSLSLTSPAFAMEGDLTLPDGAFFGALYNRLICDSFDEVGVNTPSALKTHDVQIEKLLADRMLIQFLVAANFKQDDSTCRYSMVLTRARNNALVKTDSKAFAIDGTSDCIQGKEELDKLFSGRLPYTYTKNPIRFISLKITTPTASEVCGEGADHFRVVFERVRNNTPTQPQ